jgi:hypothetical protein
LDRLPPAASAPDPDRLGPLPVPARTEAERLCVQVILHARAALQQNPAGPATAEARLVAGVR